MPEIVTTTSPHPKEDGHQKLEVQPIFGLWMTLGKDRAIMAEKIKEVPYGKVHSL